MNKFLKICKKVDTTIWKKLAAILALVLFTGVAFAAKPHNPSDFSGLTTNVKSLETQVLTIVQVVVTLAGILLVFRGVVHLKQNAAGSPQEKHMSKGIANIVFAAILFIVVPLLHMFVGTLSSNIGGAKNGLNTWTAGSAGNAQGLSSDTKKKSGS